MHELPLVLFTVLSQIAVGALLTLWILDMFNKVQNPKLGIWLSSSIFVIAVIAILASVFHLGQPFMAFLALSNIQTSWLTREIWMFSLMLVTMIAYVWTWIKPALTLRKWLGGIASLFGLLAVMGSAMIYVLPALPAWNNFSPIFFFVMSAVIIGPLYVSVFFYLFNEEDRHVWKIAPVMALVYAMSSFFYITVMFSGSGAIEMTASNIVNHPMFVMRGLLSWVAPVVLLLPFLFMKKRKPAMILVLAVFIMVFAGEIIGREIFYNTVVELEIYTPN
ncbi:dimethyl sulfoxide reductase anchor subunit family protein [Salisediminibacterium beveridgei]|nr:DmsC/YnfH family molybdoenzyme membrane anchor subunit [Salisediminibacterium beveridgei]